MVEPQSRAAQRAPEERGVRTAIKGDGSDGTVALKAWLLAHDNVMTQELYEFTAPGINGALGRPAPADPNFALTSFSSYIVPGGFAGPGVYGDYRDLTGSSVVIRRWKANNIVGLHDPGYFDFSAPAGPIGPRSAITHVVAVVSALAIPGTNIEFGGSSPWEPGYEFDISLDGGASFNPLYLGSISTTLTDYSVDITSAILSLGPMSSFDFSQIVIRVFCDASSLVDCIVPGAVLTVTRVGVEYSYDSSYTPPGIVLPTTLGRFCDASSPLTYRGDVYKPANIKNSGFKSKIGLDVDSLRLDWKFRGDEAMVTDPVSGATILTMLQGFQQGLWKGVWAKWLRVYMPTFGDCDSLGAVRMFRGRIAPVEVDRLTASITVNSVTEMFNRQVPQQLIESNNRSLQVGPGLPPDLDPDPAHWTIFQCVAGHGGTVQKIVARQTAPTADQVYAPGTFDLGYLMFAASPLKNFIAQVQHSEVIGGYNVFYLFRPLYVDPHTYPLSFTGFVPAPKDQTLSGAGGVDLAGFPRVPLPEQAV